MNTAIGRIVHYRYKHPTTGELHTRPAMIVRVWSPECVNLQVFLDGNGEPHNNDGAGPVQWVTSACFQAENDGSAGREKTWFWPPRLEAVMAQAALPDDACIVAAMATAFGLGNDAGVPADIQWMPPGTHTISAKSLKGEDKTVTVSVTAATAAAVQAAFVSMLADATAGRGDKPFFDFNHDDAIASAHPTEFYWGGDDAKTGGVRAKVTWTGAGKAAVQGKDFTRFSPIFIPRADGTAAPAEGHANMGGLVNRAAFRAIAPVAAKAAQTNPADATPAKALNKQTNNTQMNQLIAIMAKYGIVLAADAGDAVVAARAGDLITQLATDRDSAKGELTTAKASLETAVTAHATSVVDAAVAAGRIAPQDEATKGFWIGSLKSNPVAAKAALDGLPVNPALAAGTVVTAKAATVAGTFAANGEHTFIVAAKAHGAAKGITGDEALADYAAVNPSGYAAWSKSTFGEKEGA